MLSRVVTTLGASIVAAALLAGSATAARCNTNTGPSLTCTLSPTKGNTVGGTVTIVPRTGGECGSFLDAKITGLSAGAVHGWHIHEAGDISADDGTATGGHFNPQNKPHGLLGTWPLHVGDLGNLPAANRAGVSTVRRRVARLVNTRLVRGRGLIIHAKRDDGGQPTGNAGSRLAQCVLGVALPRTPTSRTSAPKVSVSEEDRYLHWWRSWVSKVTET
ncbi:hypothetical protein MMPV_003553 [Pyropia vietnamensis]